MKKPYLTNYIKSCKLIKENPINRRDTRITETVEESDPDEKFVLSSIETRQIEESDPDDLLCFGSSVETFTRESSDPDESPRYI